MADDTLTQYSRLAPYIEERGKQLLSATFGDPNAVQQTGESNEDFQARKLGRAGVAQQVPAFQVAGLTPQQQQAMAMSSQGIGQYQPFLNQASGTIGQGISSIAGSQGMFAPTAEGIQSYMDPYQQNVTQNALAELDRQAMLQQQGMNAQQIGAGAFGTERGGIQNAEMGRNLSDIKSRRIFEDMSRNFQQAQQTAQQSFEAQQGRQANAGQMLGQLGGQQAGLGQLGQNLYGADVANLLQSGALGQTQGQNVLDAQRQTQLLQNQEPFQRLSFASGILTGTPASQMSVQQQPSTNPLMQVAGLGIMGLGAYKGLNVPNLV
tara:strand:- start:548 stop:1510 length:963 start_codon:yes stop_codon:yes gene_type:complete